VKEREGKRARLCKGKGLTPKPSGRKTKKKTEGLTSRAGGTGRVSRGRKENSTWRVRTKEEI